MACQRLFGDRALGVGEQSMEFAFERLEAAVGGALAVRRRAGGRAVHGLRMEARVLTLIAHEASDYEEWGASESIRLDPGTSGRGLSFRLAPMRGAAWGGYGRRATHRGWCRAASSSPSHLEGELGYGLAAFGGRFTGTPNLGFGLSGTSCDWRIGWRPTSAVPGDLGFEVSLNATQGRG